MIGADISPRLMIGEGWADYELLDSGDGRKFERYGPHRFIRPDAQALWAPAAADWTRDWDADARFEPGADEDGGGRWHFHRSVPHQGWPIDWNDLRFVAHTTPFRHLGFFPDMMPVWTWAQAGLRAAPPREAPHETLNLFGYTGVGSLALASTGARVVHVDASRKSVEQARANAACSAMGDRPIRWIVDDAAKFVAREGRRGRRYDAIILDPPKFGRGPEGEVWRIEHGLAPLLADCRKLVDERSTFVFLTVYAVHLSALALGAAMARHFADLPGRIEVGELGVRERARGLILPTAIFARWHNDLHP